MRAVLLMLAGCGINIGPFFGEPPRDPPIATRPIPPTGCIPTAELCNDRDDDCDGRSDDGCDDDHDGYCDEAFTVMGRPKICPLGAPTLFDCDDEEPQKNPGQIELCDDGIDNDCNGFVDYYDINRCVPVTASFQDGDGLLSLLHGTPQVLRAAITPPTMEVTRYWSVTSALPYTNCSTTDVTLADAKELPESSVRTLSITDDPRKLSCRYELTLFIADVPVDRITLSMRNPRPRVTQVVGAALDGDILSMRVQAGTAPTLTAIVPIDDDDPVVVEWIGQHAPLLGCGVPCLGNQVAFRDPLPLGTYRLRLRARDGFDAINRNRDLVIEAVDCVWARAGGTGTGAGPALAQALGSIEAAVGASSTSGADVCIAGASTFNLAGTLTLPAGVSINSAFDGLGMPSTVRATLIFPPGASLRFAAGYSDAVRRVRLRGSGSQPLVDVFDASPTLFGVELFVSGAIGARGVRLESMSMPSQLRVASSQLRSDAPLNGATAIEIEGGDAPAELIWNGASTVDLLECTGECRGIALSGNARGTLVGQRIDVEAIGAGSRAIALSIEGTVEHRATAEVRLLKQLLARTRVDQPADQTVSIRLARTEGVHIISNEVIGPTTANSGARFSAAIADGEVRRDGSFERGDSNNLTIASNRQIAAGRADHAFADCSEGTDVGTGILLIGTSSVAIRSNGNNGARDNAIFGGASSAVWSSREVAPSVPAIWTIETNDVRIERNEIRSGVLAALEECSIAELPHAVAIRDSRSTGLRLTGNGIVTGRRVSFDTVPRIDRTGVRLVELSGGSAVLVNNYLAVTRGTDLIGVHARRADVELWNNVVELEAITSTGAPVAKRAIVLEDVEPAGFDLINNIVVVWQNLLDAPGATAIEDRSDRSVGRLRNNLFFVEAAERRSEGGYVRSGGMTYTRGTFEDYAATVDAAGNLILPPLFQPRQVEHWRSQTHLTPRSPAIDAGQSEGAPPEDRFGRPRPLGAGVDIGIEEYVR